MSLTLPINRHTLVLTRDGDAHRLPLIMRPEGMFIANGYTYLHTGGQTFGSSYVASGSRARDREGNLYEVQVPGFRGSGPPVRGPMYQIHPDPAVSEVWGGFVLHRDRVPSREGTFHYMESGYHIISHRPYTVEERDEGIGDSERSFMICSQMNTMLGTVGIGGHFQYWNDFAMDHTLGPRVWCGVTVEFWG